MTPWASKHVSQRVRPSAPGRRLLPLPCRPCRPARSRPAHAASGPRGPRQGPSSAAPGPPPPASWCRRQPAWPCFLPGPRNALPVCTPHSMGRPAAHPCCSGHTHSTPLQTGEPRGPGQTSGWQQRPLRDQRGPSRASRGAPQGGQGSSGAVLAGVILTDVDSCVPPPELFRFRQEPGGQHDAFRPGHPWRPVHGPWAAVGSPHPQPPRRPGAHGLPVLPADLAGVRPRDGPAGGVRGGEDGPGPEWQPPLIPPQARPAPSPPPLFLGGNF